MSTYAITRKTSLGSAAKRKYYSGFSENGKPVYMSLPKNQLWSYGNLLRTYTSRRKALWAVKVLKDIDQYLYFRDCRRLVGFFQVVEV